MSQKNSSNSDFIKIVGTAISSVTGVVKDVKDELNEKILSYLEKMDLVKREEFEVVQEMLRKSRVEQELIKNKLEALEKKIQRKQ